MRRARFRAHAGGARAQHPARRTQPAGRRAGRLRLRPGDSRQPDGLRHGATRARGRPHRHALDGPTIELRVFVDGNLVETFFHGGEAFLFTSTRNNVPSANVSSAFVNTAGLDCNVSSWVLGL